MGDGNLFLEIMNTIHVVWSQIFLLSLRLLALEEERRKKNNTIKSGHYVLPAMPRGSAHTPLKPKLFHDVVDTIWSTDANWATRCGGTDADWVTSIRSFTAVSPYLKLKESNNRMECLVFRKIYVKCFLLYRTFLGA